MVSLAAQQALPVARFEFGIVKPVTGILRRDPYPSLEVDGRRVWLVGEGKFGAERVLAGIANGPVTVEGSAIERGKNRMLELRGVRPGSEPGLTPVRVDTDPAPTPVSLSGEIVDSKCFLGVMNPSEGPVHRDCARRCLSGGIPPMLIVRDGHGREELVVLVSADGHPLERAVRAMAGRPVSVTGRLARDGETWKLYVRTASYTP